MVCACVRAGAAGPSVLQTRVIYPGCIGRAQPRLPEVPQSMLLVSWKVPLPGGRLYVDQVAADTGSECVYCRLEDASWPECYS